MELCSSFLKRRVKSTNVMWKILSEEQFVKMMQMAALLWLAMAYTPQTPPPKELLPHLLCLSVLLLITTQWWRQIQMEFWNLCSTWLYTMSLPLIVTGVRGSFWVEKVFQRRSHGQRCSFYSLPTIQTKDVGLCDTSSITTTEQLCQLITRGSPKGTYPNCSKNTVCLHQNNTERMQNRETFMSVGNETGVKHSCCYPKPKEEFIPACLHVWILLWRLTGRWSCVCLLITVSSVSSQHF